MKMYSELLFISSAKYLTGLMIIFSAFFCNVYSQQGSDTIEYVPIKDTLNKTADSLKSKSDMDAIVEYSAKDSAIFDVESSQLLLYNEGELKYKEYDLKGARVILHKDISIMESYGVTDSSGKFVGTPVFLEGSKKYEASKLRYNFKTRQGNIEMGSTELEGGYYLGEKIKKVSEDVFFIQNGRYTTCDKADPDFYFGSPKMKIIQGDKVIAEPVYVYIDDVPIFAIPFGIFPNHSGRSSGIIPPAYGEDPTFGRYLSHLGYFWAINDYIDLALQGNYFTNNRIDLESRFRYVLRYKYTGSIELGGSRIRSGEPTDLDKQFSDQWHIGINHSQTFDPTMSLSANVSLYSSKTYLTNTTNNLNNLLQQNAVSTVTLTKYWEGTPNSLSINYSRDQNLISGEISQVVPALNFVHSQTYPLRSKSTSLLNLKWYENISYSYNAQLQYRTNKILVNSAIQDGNFNHNDRGGVTQSVNITAPIKLSEFSLSPFINYNEVWYHKYVLESYDPVSHSVITTDKNGFKAFRYFNTGISLNTRLIGIFNTKFLGVVRGFRHTILPTITYTYTPDFSKPQWHIYGTYIDSTGKPVTYPFFQKEIFGYASSGEQQNLGLSVNNIFEMKVKETDTSNTKLQILNLGTTLNYNIAADSLKFSELGLNFRTQAGNWLNIAGSSSFNLYKYVDSIGRVNKFLWNTDKKLAQLTSFSINLSTSLQGGQDQSAKKDTTSKVSNSTEYTGIYGEEPVDFSIPWSISLNYNYSLDKHIPSVINKSSNLSANLGFNLTPNWKFTFSTSYDIFQKQFSAPYVTIYRDLHCWEMNFNWVPTGLFRGFRFEIRIKAPQLQDVKVTKQTNYRGVF
jgi:lipopolysaccharide assembly outer membrane protein LptD (OstA)